ncbi:MAG: Sec1-like protein [Piptocephalis tieghemiana]|nr:MAG: Sec1-like protein [Piptocephalis tieghemiana]
MGFSIKTALKNRYLETVDSVQPPARWKLVVVDSKSVKLLSAACKMYDIMEKNVTLIENVEKKRQPFPNLEALYFLTPNPDSIALMVEDFTKSEPMYAAAHLFFTTSLHDGLFKFITTSKASKFVKSCQELMVDFFPLESRAFSLDRPNAFYSLYGPSESRSRDSTGTIPSPTPAIGPKAEVEAMSKQLISVLATLGENPIIRFHRPSASTHGFNRSKIPERLAFSLQEALDQYCAINENFPPKSDPPQPRGTLYILDRTIDITATLVHEFTYQAMANDLLPIEEGGTKYVHEFSSNGGTPSSKEIILDEEDPVWVSIRHSHIAKCSGRLVEDFRQLMASNKAAVAASSSSSSSDPSQGGTPPPPSSSSSLNTMKDVLADLPQFQEQKARYSAHISIAQECMDVFERRKLGVIGSVEQDLACRETPEGKTPRKVLNDLVPLLDDESLSDDEVVRLLALYIIYREGLKEDDLWKLQEHAHLSRPDQEALESLEPLGIRLIKSSPRSRDDLRNRVRMPKMGWAHMKKKLRSPGSNTTEDDDDDAIELSRYVPEVKRLLEAHMENRVEEDVFPFTRQVSVLEATEQVRKAPTSLRSNRANWQRGGDGPGSSSASSNGDGGKPSSKLILFIAGGMTYSEMRSVYEIASAYHKEVLIGSTHIITPEIMLRDMRRLRYGPPPPPKPPTPPPLPPQAPTAAMGAMHLNGAGGPGGPGGEKKKKGGLFSLTKGIF